MAGNLGFVSLMHILTNIHLLGSDGTQIGDTIMLLSYQERAVRKGITESSDSFGSSVIKDESVTLNKVLHFRITAIEGSAEGHVESLVQRHEILSYN